MNEHLPSKTQILEALKAPSKQVRWLPGLFYIQLDHHGVGLMVAQIVLRSERVQNWRLRPSTPHQTRRSPTGRLKKKKLYRRCLIWSVRSGRALMSNMSQDSPRRESVSDPGSSQWEFSSRGKKERVMWRRSASDFPDSTWKSKRKIIENEKKFLTAKTHL